MAGLGAFFRDFLRKGKGGLLDQFQDVLPGNRISLISKPSGSGKQTCFFSILSSCESDR